MPGDFDPKAYAADDDEPFDPKAYAASSDEPQTSNQSTADAVMGQIAQGMRSAGTGILKGVTAVGDFTDHALGIRALRSGISSLQNDSKFTDEYEKNPSFKDIAVRAGVPGEETIGLPLVKNPFTQDKKERYVHVSPAGIVGAVADIVVDPTNYVGPGLAKMAASKSAGAIAKGLGKAGELGLEAAASTSRGVGRKAARVIAGVEEENFNKYLQGRDRIVDNAAKHSTEDILDKVDAGVEQVIGDRDLTQKRVADGKAKLDQDYQHRRRELEGKSTSLEEARAIMSDLDAEKATLGTLSKQADDALVRSGASFQKDHLIALIDQAGAAIGPDIVGKEAQAAVSGLMDTRARLEHLPDTVSGERLRNILQQIRKDIDFDMAAGEFNSDLNRARKHVAGRISGALKEASPEYAAYMSRMADLADSLGDMRRHFGTETAAIGSMDIVRKGKAAGSQPIEDILRTYADHTGRKDLTGKLDTFQQNRETLERMKTGDLRGELFPDQAKALQEMEAEATMAQDIAGGVERLDGWGNQSKIRRQGSKEPPIYDKRAFEALENATGENYRQMIDDRNVFDSFGKDHTRGSRMTVAGGAMGGWIGGKMGGPGGAVAGAAMGGAAGATADKYGGVIVRKALDKGVDTKRSLEAAIARLQTDPQSLGRFRKVLEQAAKQGTRGLLVTHHILMNEDPEYRAMIIGEGE